MVLLIYLIVRMVIWFYIVAFYMALILLAAALYVAVLLVGAVAIGIACIVRALIDRHKRKQVERAGYAAQVAAFQRKLKVMDLREVHKRGLNTTQKGR